MSANLVKGVMGLSLILLVPCAAQASTIYDNWQGTSLIQSEYPWVAAHVSYWVYDIGQCPFADPSGGTQYVYAYQIKNDGAGANARVYTFSVGLSGGNEQASHATYVADDASHMAPLATALSAQTVGWDFYANTAGAGLPRTKVSTGVSGMSDLLIYTSPFPPEWDTLTMTAASGIQAYGYMPSPTPEPASMCLLAVGAMALAARRSRKVN